MIDVGTTRVPDATRKSGFRLNGDVKFDEVAERCSCHHPCSWRCRSYDHLLADEEYIGCRKENSTSSNILDFL